MSARDTLIASVTGLVRRRGVAGTGLNALLEDSGVSRRTIYLNFPGGKQELVAEATRLAGNELTAIIKAAGDDVDPARGIQLFIELWKAQLAETEMQAGCPVVAAVLGRTEAPEAAAVAADAFELAEDTHRPAGALRRRRRDGTVIGQHDDRGHRRSGHHVDRGPVDGGA